MRRAVLPLLILAAVVLAALLAWLTLNRLHWGGGGGREVVAQSRPAGPFSHLDVTGRAEVVLVQGTVEAVVVEAPAGEQSRIETSVRNGTLAIRTRSTGAAFLGIFGDGHSRPPRITVTFRALESIELAGATRVEAARIDVPDLRVSAAGASELRVADLRAQTLRISGAGAFKAELAGAVREQSISFAGAGTYRAARLASQEAKVSVAGAAKVLINVEKTLRVSLSGAGLVEYFGDPEVKESVSGAGKIRRRDAQDERSPRRTSLVAGGRAELARVSA